jgi:16S rRNA processing protein RimM
MGQVSGVFGVQGWLKVHSHTRPRANLLDYKSWLLGHPGDWRTVKVTGSRAQGPSLLAKLDGVDTREAAEALLRQQIAVPRSALPKPARNEYYWAELIGMSVRNQEQRDLGQVVRLVEAGDHDVLVIRGEPGETLIPFVQAVYVLRVDRAARLIEVDWQDPE